MGKNRPDNCKAMAFPDRSVATDNDLFAPAAGAAPARHRLSVLFCDLCDSTALSGALEAEDYAGVLSALRRIYDEAVTRHGGTVVRILGDGLLAVFGHPVPSESDGRRAVLAALQMHEAVKRLPAPPGMPRGLPEGLRLHSGVHAGLVLVQEGDHVVGRLELLGVVPNVAARLSAEAARDELLVSDETLGPARAQFRTAAARRLRVPGHEVPIDCWPVVGRAESPPGAAPQRRGARTGFVGRAPELHRLDTALAEALAGATRQVAIVGPPGVGKTRLASEFLQRAAQRGCRVLAGWCESELAAVPLQPVLQMVRSALGLTADAPVAAALNVIGAALELQGLADVLPTLMPLLGGHAPASGSGPGAASSSGAPGAASTAAGAAAGTPPAPSAPPADPVPAIARLFANWSVRQPLVLFIDDWHWSDAASRQALAAIGTATAEVASGLLVLVSTREVDASDATMRQLEVLPLAPFTREEGEVSIRALLPQVDPWLAEQIYRHSGGNPLFIEELCHDPQRAGTPATPTEPAPRAAGRQAGAAAWLQVLIESRVARLPPAQAALVRTLAVIGNVVPAPLLAAVTGLAPDDAALAELAEKDFVFPGPDGTLRFKHGLTRSVVYDAVGQRERRELHLRVAAALQRPAGAASGADAPHEALAWHFAAAGRHAEAAHHAELAGDRAAALSALDRAKAHYHAALEHLAGAGLDSGRVQRWLAIANKLGLICVFDASRKDLPVFEQAVVLAAAQAEGQSDKSLHARAEYWLGYLLYALGEARNAVAHCRRAAALAGPGNDALAVQVRATLGQALAAASDYAAAEPLLADAVAIKRSHRRSTKTAVGLAYTLVCHASVVGDRGEFAHAHELFDEAWALVGGVTHEIGASITGWRAVVLGWQGRWAEAVEAAELSTHIAEQTHSLFQFCQGRATGAYAEWMLKGEPAAIDRLAESTQWLEPRESGLFRSLDHGWLTECWLGRGEVAKARTHAARVLVRGRAGDLIGVALGCRAMARDAAARGDFTTATRWLQRAQRIAAQRESRHEAAGNELCAAEIARLRRDADTAQRLGEAAVAGFEQLQMAWHAARARQWLAQPVPA